MFSDLRLIRGSMGCVGLTLLQTFCKALYAGSRLQEGHLILSHLI